jgi:hypothetical protein
MATPIHTSSSFTYTSSGSWYLNVGDTDELKMIFLKSYQSLLIFNGVLNMYKLTKMVFVSIM